MGLEGTSGDHLSRQGQAELPSTATHWVLSVSRVTPPPLWAACGNVWADPHGKLFLYSDGILSPFIFLNLCPLDTRSLIYNLSYLHPPPLSTAAFKSKGSNNEPWVSISQLLAHLKQEAHHCFPPSFPLHPAEPGSRPDLWAHRSCLPSATYYSWRSRETGKWGSILPCSPQVQPHWNIRQGWAHAGNDKESSESSTAPWHLPSFCCSPQERGNSQQSEHVRWGWAERKWESLEVDASFGGLAQSSAKAGCF